MAHEGEIENLIGQLKSNKLKENIKSHKPEVGSIVPLVPIKYIETGGAADDLQPIKSLNYRD